MRLSSVNNQPYKIKIDVEVDKVGNRYYYHSLDKLKIDSPHVPYDVKPLQTLPQEFISNNIIFNPAKNINIPNIEQKVPEQILMPVKDTSLYVSITHPRRVRP